MDSKLAKIAEELEKDLKFEGAVGLRNAIKPDAVETINSLKNMGINAHILSGDNYDQCLMTAQALGLTPGEENKDYFHFNFTSMDVAQPQLKRAIEKVNESVTKLKQLQETKSQLSLKSTPPAFRKSYSIIIDGSTIDFISKDLYLLEHMKLILEFTNSVVGYRCTPLQKGIIVRLFKELNRVTLAVGDGYNDILMLQTANVGIQIYNPEVLVKFGDINLTYLRFIPHCILHYCRDWNSNMQLVQINLYKYSSILLFVTAIYQIYCQFTAATPFQDYLLTTTGIFTVFTSLPFIFINKSIRPEVRQKVPGFYCEKNYMTKVLDIKKLFYHLVSECSDRSSLSVW